VTDGSGAATNPNRSVGHPNFFGLDVVYRHQGPITLLIGCLRDEAGVTA
jgi:hypothetical protein